MHLTLRQLQYFREIIDAGNMTRAADKLNVAPTALSLQVKSMEERLGVGLLQRHSRGVRPTPAGAELYRKGKQILALVDETERVVGPAAAGRRLRLGVPPSVLRMIGVDAVLAGSKRSEGFAVQLVEGFSRDLVRKLQSGELDFVLACELQPSASMRTLDLIEERLVFATCCAAARAGGRVTLAEALASDLVFYGEHDVCWKLVHAAASSASLPVNVAQKVGSIDVIRHMISRGLATAVIPYGIIEEECRRGELAVHVIYDHPILRRLSLGWLKENEITDDARQMIRFVDHASATLHKRTAPHSNLFVHAPGAHVAGSS